MKPRWQQDILDFFPFRTSLLEATLKLMVIIALLAVVAYITYDEIAGVPASPCVGAECYEPLSPPYPQEVH